MMGRSRNFDLDATLDQVVEVFWRKGFAAVSIDDLEGATGLFRASLYKAYGGKQAMFMLALERYWQRVMRERHEILDDEDPRRAITRMLEHLIGRLADPDTPRGCLLTNTCVEASYGDENVRSRAAHYLAELESLIHATLERARVAGQLPSASDTRALARFYVGVMRGMAVMHRVHGDASFATDMARVALAAWDTPALPPLALSPRRAPAH
jgi:TetR/AcrR family transcriptional regulator, transcriptional repressor for nem operon